MSKFLFSGTFESGKTTLATLFSTRPNIVIVNEVARDIISARPDLAKAPLFHDLNFAEQLRREELANYRQPTEIICDRGVLDIIAYARVLGNPLKREWFESLHKRYDRVIIFYKDDVDVGGLSATEIKFRDEIDREIRRTCVNLGISPIELKGSPIERFEMVDSMMRDDFRNKEGNLSRIEGNL